MDVAINQRVISIREALGVSVNKFAGMIGISQTAYSKIDRCVGGLSLTVFKALVLKFDIDPAWLLTGEGEVPKLLLEKPHLIPHLNPHLNPSLNPSLITDSEPGEYLDKSDKYDNLDISKSGESTNTSVDLSNMKPEDFNRLLRVEDRLRRQLGIQEELISVMREEIHELRQIIEDHANSEKQGEVRRFKKAN